MIQFTGERIVPGADNCEPLFAEKMYQEHLARYAFAAQWIKDKRVLDVGCGVGYGSLWLAQHGASSVLAFDLSTDAISHAREFYHHPNISYQIASATNFDFGQFDVITCFELIEHVDDQEAVLSSISAALNEDGILIISTPRALAQKRTHFHTKEFSEHEFRELLESRFGSVRFFFENNHFSSLITDHQPSRLDRIITLKNQFTLTQCDYFIAIATLSKNAILNLPDPVLVLGNDSYVTLLERDVGILHDAESMHLGKIDSLKLQLSDTNESIASLNKLLSERDLSIEQLKIERNNLNIALEVAKNDARYLQDIISQVHVSASWRLTAPLRKLSENFRAPVRLIKKIAAYKRQYGSRMLVSAIRRRLASSNTAVKSVSFEPVATPIAAVSERFDVIFAIGCWEGESKRYRVYNIAAGLTDFGYTTHIIPFEKIAEIADRGILAKTVVLFRAPLQPSIRIDVFLNYAKLRGIKVIFDVDDLVFEPEIISQIHGVKALTAEQREQYAKDTHAYYEMLKTVDAVTVPTEYLRARAQALGCEAFVVPNTINGAQLNIATQLASKPKAISSIIRIGYFSGSRTHQADFAECADALLRAMQSHSDIVLRIVGFLDLDKRWDAFAERIERIDFQPYEAMLITLSECDINIAPLEMNNSFCNAKSELKFFEAGLVGVPTIASATDTFTRAISNGVDGFLCDNPQSWSATLEKLINSKILRDEIGKKAKETATSKYLYSNAAKIAAQAFGLEQHQYLSDNTEMATQPFSLRIAWVVPGLIIGGGGHRNILRAAYFLAQFGHKISLYFTGTEFPPHVLKKQIQDHFYPLDCPVHLFEGKIHPADVVFATHWTTVAAALTARNETREIIYFVQDFEPAFAPMGTEYVLAENTYRLGLYHITSGPWCEVMLRRDFGAEADHFQFPVDRSVYYPRPRTKTNKNLIFFAKPEMPRRCFELGVMALREFNRLMPDVEIIMFGSKHARQQNFDFPVTIRDVLPTLDDLAEMYSNGDVGLVFSTTNPSLIPYEMMACGLVVVDLDRGDNHVNYGNRKDIALLANPLPELMAQDIARLLNNSDEISKRREAGSKFVSSFPTEIEMARRIESLILTRITRSDC
jgi:glycosyltransferase involved in cell wall biosynthesis/SAM-dependent methyltransferase